MRKLIAAIAAVGLVALVASPALADDRLTARDIESALDSYLAGSTQDANLVGGPGSAGYDSGFWIRGGEFLLRTNLTLQARYEFFDYDDSQPPELGDDRGGDLSGFSLPRATVKFSGHAPCDMRYYVELEFGHFGRDAVEDFFGRTTGQTSEALGPIDQSFNYDNTREAWIEWGCSPEFNIRMGQIKTPATRQLMVAPELQQFVDIALGTAFVGNLMPGYTDRNRDHGVMFHGVFGCDGEFSYMLAVTNGDSGDSIRNVLDTRTDDGVAFSGRVNWAFMDAIGYQEGALRQQTCSWYGELGLWAFMHNDRLDKPHVQVTDSLRYGLDLALGYGGWSFTAAYSLSNDERAGGAEADTTAWLAQLGYHFPGSAWEIAARASSYDVDPDAGFGGGRTGILFSEGAVTEFAFGVNYYLNGHGNKLQLDASMISGSDAGSALIYDPYPGYGDRAFGDEDFGILFRFQWQLAL